MSERPHPHIVPLKLYIAVFLSLIAGTALTVAAAYVNMGWLNTPVALLIAASKAILVVLFFMHVRYSNPLIWLFAGAGFLWLLIMLSLTLQDYMTRGWETPPPIEFLIQGKGPF